MSVSKEIFRKLTVSMAIVTMVLVSGFYRNAFGASKTLTFTAAEKHVQINVEVHGHIDGHTVETVEHVILEWLEAAHFIVSHTDGAGYLHLHVRLDLTDDHHFKVHSDCADWHEDKEAAVVDAIDDILHHMIDDFIAKYSH